MSEEINDLSKRIDILKKKTGETFIEQQEIMKTLSKAVCNLYEKNSFLMNSIEVYQNLFQQMTIALHDKKIFTDKESTEILKPLTENILRLKKLAEEIAKEEE